MKKPRTGIFKNADGKWNAVSAKIRNLYDSVLKETVPQNLRASTQLNPLCGPKKATIEAEPTNTPEIAEPDSPVSGAMEAIAVANTPSGIEQGETPSPLPDQSNIQTGDSKN